MNLRPFPESEHRERLARVRAEMAARGAGALIVDSVEHLTWLIGYHMTGTMYQPCLVPLEGEPVMIVRELDEIPFREASWVQDAVTFADTDDPVEVLARTARERGWSRAGIAVELDSHFLPVRRYEAIKAALPAARFIDFAKVMWELRLLKSPREIEYVRQAAAIADAATTAAIEAVGPGKSEREAAATFYATALRLGADNGRQALIVGGKRSDSLHGALGTTVLEPGDILHVEAAPTVRTYSARCMRSTVIGEASAEQQETARRLIEIQDRQIAAMHPGAIARDVDAICRQGVLDAGLRERYTNNTGYTLGTMGVPRTSDFTRIFVPTADWPIEAGMLFHMYTWARGMAFSDTVLVTPTGPERLTRLDRRLFVR